MTTTIRSIRRYGSHYVATLACGCKLTLTADELRVHQVYIGKQVVCSNHAQEVRNQ